MGSSLLCQEIEKAIYLGYLYVLHYFFCLLTDAIALVCVYVI